MVKIIQNLSYNYWSYVKFICHFVHGCRLYGPDVIWMGASKDSAFSPDSDSDPSPTFWDSDSDVDPDVL